MNKLPKELQQKEIKDLKQGESGYTLPWAMNATDNGTLWIRCDYPVFSSPHKEAVMKIKITDDIVFVYRSTIPEDFKYKPHGSIQTQWDSRLVEFI